MGETNHFVVLAIVIGLSIYLQLTWLTGLLAIVGALLVITAIPARPKPVAKGGGAPKEEEILSPVIVVDTGEAPYLYPTEMNLKTKVSKGWSTPMYEDATTGIFAAVKGVMGLTGLMPAKKKK